jgi:hypothetical protein
MKNVITLFVLMFALSSFLFSQTPQYYNANTGGISNSIPFGSASISGYKSQYLMLSNEYILPSPAPAGNITKFYINMSSTGSGTYTQFTIKMGQSSITVFPSGIYTGQLDTVYHRVSGTFSSTAGTWMMIELDRPFTYDPAQSLIIEISHCGITGTGMSVFQSAGTASIYRRNNIPGTTSCIFTYSGQDGRIFQCGVDILVTGIEPIVSSQIPNEYKLEQNYPNPFNPVTKINFGLQKTGFVTLKIYDVLGKEVATLVNGVKNAGSYSVDFNGSSLSSGMYLYRLETNGYVSTKEMILLK